MILRFGLVALPAAWLGLTGCAIPRDATGPMRTDPVSVEKGKAEMVRVELKIGAGEIGVRGGSPKLMDGSFSYSAPSSKPTVRYDSSSFRGLLTVEQPSSPGGLGNRGYSWDLRFNDDTPLDMRVNLGAGQAEMDLGSLTLKELNIDMGVGQLDLDLRGNPKADYSVHVHGGVGQATIHLPLDVGVSAEAHGGIGSIHVEGLRKEGNRYYNAAWDKAKIRVRVAVEGGVGEIDLIGG